jgi:hypothetical protein
LPPLGNTYPANFTGTYQEPILCGIDSLYMSFYGNLRREIVTGTNDEGRRIVLAEYEFSLNSKGRGAYDFTLDNEWMNISVGNRFQSSLSPPVYVQVKSDFIHFQGLKVAYQVVVSVVNNLFLGGVESEQVSRADLFTDSIWQQGFQPGDINQIVTRGKKSKADYENKTLSGFTVGRGAVMARIYNKSLEIKESGKDWFHQLWKIDESLPVWRTEVQFRREFFNDYGINTFQELIDSRQSLWNYATTKWLSMREPGNDNPSRRPFTEFWQVVQRADFSDGQKAPAVPLTKKEKTGMEEEKAIPAIIGYAKSVAKNKRTTTLESLKSMTSKAIERVEAEGT